MKWIPTSERMPDEFGYYLITRILHKIPTVAMAHYFGLTHGGDVYWGHQDGLRIYEQVTAWMELPEPYKETK